MLRMYIIRVWSLLIHYFDVEIALELLNTFETLEGVVVGPIWP